MSNLATIVNNILADSGIDDINVVVTNGSYSNPAWITALGWSKITGTPTTLAGYGITNAYTKTEVDTLLNAKQNTLTLTTTGSSGASTLVGATLNIPTYTLSGLGGVPTSRTLTINGVAQDLSADRSWTIAAGVTSVNAGTGISVNQTTGAVTVTNTGVLSINGSTGVVTGILTTSNYNSYAPTLTGGGASGTWGINITGNSNYASSAGSANTAAYLPTLYAGGVQSNPQVYFGQSVGLRVAMTGVPFAWCDTLWINGYSGGDVLSMTAIHTARNGQPRMWLSAQNSNGTSYGTTYEVVTSWNSPYALNMNQYVRTTDSVGFSAVSSDTFYNGRYTYWNCGVAYASGNDPRRFEVGRIGIDYNDWNGVGTFEVELQETYYYAGGRKRYVISYGYNGPVISCTLVECNGVGSFSNYKVTVGSEVVVSGDWRYIPIYVDIQYYSQVAVQVRTTRNITNSAVPEVGYAKVFTSPAVTAISAFSVDNTVYLTSNQAPISNTDIYATNYFNVNTGRAASEHGYAALLVNSQYSSSNYVPFSFESTYGTHSWGVVARFRINQASADKPSIQFSAAGTENRWNIGYNTGSDDNFRITKNMGMRNDGGNDGWGTEYFRINTDGTTYLGIQGQIVYFNGAESANLYGIRGRFTNEFIHLYNKVGVGNPGGWGVGEANTPVYGLSTYGAINVGYGYSANSAFNGGKLLVLSNDGSYGQFQINSTNTSTEATALWSSGGSGANSGQYTYIGVVGLGAYGNSRANFYIGAGYSSPAMYIPNSEANVYAINSFRAPAFYETSDIRIKTILEDNSRVLGIQAIKPKLYEKNGKKEFGYIAQDFLDIMPYSVTENEDGYYGLAYREVHSAKIAYLEDSVEEIKEKIKELENQLKQIQ